MAKKASRVGIRVDVRVNQRPPAEKVLDWREKYKGAAGSPGPFPFLRITERERSCESSGKPPRSGVTRIAGGGAQRNPRSRAEAEESRVAASRPRPSGDGEAATRLGLHDFDSGGSAPLHPRLRTSCRSAAAVVPNAITGMDPPVLDDHREVLDLVQVLGAARCGTVAYGLGRVFQPGR